MTTSPQATTRQLTIGGRPVRIDGPADTTAHDTVLMVHGWPDTAALWDGTVSALSATHRCVRLTLPGFAADDPHSAHTLDEVVALLRAVVLQVAGGAPVTLLLHDWGCLFGYELYRRHPELVSRIVGIDVGDANSAALRRALSLKAKLMVLVYQLWLALAWKIGGKLGDRMARFMARVLRVPTPQAEIRSAMGYPYWITWTGAHGSYKATRTLHPQVPMFFAYGERKPFMFHSPAWRDALAGQPGCRVQGFRAGHWVMLDAPGAFHDALTAWLAQTGRG